MEDELRQILLIIARKLNRFSKLFSDVEFNDFIIKADSFNLDELIKWACRFLDLAFNNLTIFFFLKNDFIKIYNKLLSEYEVDAVPISSLHDVIRKFQLMEADLYLDGHFEQLLNDNILDINSLNVAVDKEHREKMLFELYGLNGNILMARDGKVLSGAYAVVELTDGICLNIYTYTRINSSFVLSVYDNIAGTPVIKKIIIPDEILEICFKESKDGLRYETVEFMYVNALNRADARGFIDAMRLRRNVNMKSVMQIRKKVVYNVESVKEKILWITKN